MKIKYPALIAVLGMISSQLVVASMTLNTNKVCKDCAKVQAERARDAKDKETLSGRPRGSSQKSQQAT